MEVGRFEKLVFVFSEPSGEVVSRPADWSPVDLLVSISLFRLNFPKLPVNGLRKDFANGDGCPPLLLLPFFFLLSLPKRLAIASR